ncbi:hypothetical protein CMV_019966 [Castanea mollissima]|uniref:Pirin N-terminal domain-containing protein n=1 Tax=Castanea mollissima TaxID=60419 RepID=A0A8J4VAW3_9ROSI|nr:hypothetical protein CMV_019966 [Castanea mollissima]
MKQPRFRRLDTTILEVWAFKLVNGEGLLTVTYMLQGGITHQDSAGHKDTIGPCDVQKKRRRRDCCPINGKSRAKGR